MKKLSTYRYAAAFIVLVLSVQAHAFEVRGEVHVSNVRAYAEALTNSYTDVTEDIDELAVVVGLTENGITVSTNAKTCMENSSGNVACTTRTSWGPILGCLYCGWGDGLAFDENRRYSKGIKVWSGLCKVAVRRIARNK